MRVTSFVLFLIAIFLLISCKKRYDTDPFGYLTKENWKIVKRDVRVGNGGTWTDDFSSLLACKKDDETIFQSDGVYLLAEGASKCNATDPSTITNSTWYLSADNKKITFPTPAPEWLIEKMDSRQLIFTYSMDVGPVTYYYRVTMQH